MQKKKAPKIQEIICIDGIAVMAVVSFSTLFVMIEMVRTPGTLMVL